ncbi:MAG: hypothetical protein JWQ25_385 [Daejeonella sp.]|nr:hypothetical protein [Daejeonella sp.]
MKKLVLMLFLVVIMNSAKAQLVSLTPAELTRLKKEIKQNEAAKNIINSIEDRAKKALVNDPNPVELIQSQGLLMGNAAKATTMKAVADVNKVFSLALTYKLNGDENYLNKTVDFLKAWATVNKPDGNPVNETKLEDMFFGYDLIRNDISKPDRILIDNWLDRMATAAVNSPSGKGDKGTGVNNWNSHRIKVITQIASILKNGKYDTVITRELNRQLENNLNADGSTYDFYERDALHYHIFSVEPLTKAAIYLHRATGENWFVKQSSKGGSIKASVDFLVPFVTGEKPHKEFLNSKVAFDRKRASNNEKGYIIADFIPSKGIVALSAASYFDKGYLDVINKAVKTDEPYLNWETLLNMMREK